MSASFTCPSCGLTSHNKHDIKEDYCCRCHKFMANWAVHFLLSTTLEDQSKALSLGYVFVRSFAPGRFLAVEGLFFESAYLKLCSDADSFAADDVWQYEDRARAIVAAAMWNPSVTPEPFGWYRHPQSGRRRPHGNPSEEHVHP